MLRSKVRREIYITHVAETKTNENGGGHGEDPLPVRTVPIRGRPLVHGIWGRCFVPSRKPAAGRCQCNYTQGESDKFLDLSEVIHDG